MKLGPAIHACVFPIVLPNGKWGKDIQRREVRIMAIAENYAMVRRRGAMPYVVSIKELEQP